MKEEIDVKVVPEITEEEKKVVDRLVIPHTKVSRDVTEADIDRVIEESVILYKLCFTPVGLYPAAFAMAHPQIDMNDPLRIFVTADRRIILNPVIKEHSSYLVDSREGCMTYPLKETITVKRWRKCDVEYVTIMVDPDNKDKFKLSSPIQEHLVGREAWIWQHEVDHLDSMYIYDKLSVNE